MNGFPWLSLLTALPLAGAAAVMLAGRRQPAARWLALGFSAAALLLVLVLWSRFDRTSGTLQFAERWAWIPALNVEYRLGVDGLGLLMLLLSAIVVPIGMAASWTIEERVPLYFALLLVLESCLFGAFTALNFVHWFTFWELSLIPAFFLIKIWGGARRGPRCCWRSSPCISRPASGTSSNSRSLPAAGS
jgi:NADH-quinone oxidoreductase subunit M